MNESTNPRPVRSWAQYVREQTAFLDEIEEPDIIAVAAFKCALETMTDEDYETLNRDLAQEYRHRG